MLLQYCNDSLMLEQSVVLPGPKGRDVWPWLTFLDPVSRQTRIGFVTAVAPATATNDDSATKNFIGLYRVSFSIVPCCGLYTVVYSTVLWTVSLLY